MTIFGFRFYFGQCAAYPAETKLVLTNRTDEHLADKGRNFKNRRKIVIIQSGER